jgi:hypothetical protein
MFEFIKKIFKGKKVEEKSILPKRTAPVPPKYNKSYSTKQQPIKTTYDDGFLTSQIVAEVTDSTLFGTSVGDMLNNSDNTPSNDNSFGGFGGGDSGGGGAGGDWGSDNSSHNSSYDSSSSFDSSSSSND